MQLDDSIDLEIKKEHWGKQDNFIAKSIRRSVRPREGDDKLAVMLALSSPAHGSVSNPRSAVEGAYAKQGFLFENFDPATGAGLGAHPFTGWTATIALLKEESPATKQREDL